MPVVAATGTGEAAMVSNLTHNTAIVHVTVLSQKININFISREDVDS